MIKQQTQQFTRKLRKRSFFGNYVLDKTDGLAAAGSDFTGQRKLPMQTLLAVHMCQSRTPRPSAPCRQGLVAVAGNVPVSAITCRYLM